MKPFASVVTLLGAITLSVASGGTPPSRGAGPGRPLCPIRVYCAGPMNGPKDFDEMRALAARLRDAGFETYLPVDDGFPLVVLFDALEKSARPAREIVEAKRWMMVAVYSLDMYRLLGDCNAAVCDVNHFADCSVSPDPGTVMEASLAYAYGRPLCFYKTDEGRILPDGARKGEGWDNPMIVGMADRFDLVPDYAADSADALVADLRKACAGAGPLITEEGGCQFARSTPQRRMPEQVRRWIGLGKQVAAVKARFIGKPLVPALALREVEEVAACVKAHAAACGVPPWNGRWSGSATADAKGR